MKRPLFEKAVCAPGIHHPGSTMRQFSILLLGVLIAGCGDSLITRTQALPKSSAPVTIQQQSETSVDSIQQYLLAAAASDFQTHGPSHIVRFRDVHLRFLTSEAGEKVYMLCGQFLSEQEGGKAQWTPFSTIKTSEYEQYIGGQFCQEGSALPGKEEDLSALLLDRFNVLR